MAALTGNSVNSTSYLSQGLPNAPTINVSNAQRLGLGNASLNPTADATAALQKSFATSATSAGMLKPQAPVSPVTQKPVSSFGSGITPPAASTASSGAYKGIPIDTTGDVAAQMAAIDKGVPTTTSTGSTVSADHQGGVTSPSSFTIDTSGPVSSNVLGSDMSTSDVLNAHKSYADYVNGLSQAQQYSPDYIAALNAANAAKLHGAELTSNFYTGNHLPGDTLGYAQGFTTRESALNDIRSLSANQALQVQELVRQGNIAGAKALVDAYAPQSVSPGSSLVNPVTGDETYSGLGGYQAVQGIQTVNNLAQNYPDANILPTDTLAEAQKKAQNAPSFQARQTYLQTLAGGSTVAYNKLTGQYEVVQGAGDATAQNAASAAIKELTSQKASVQSAVSTADANFPLLLKAADQAGVNNSVPLINQLEQKFGKNFNTTPAYAALQTLLPSLQTEYARILSRGGAVTDSERANSTALINGTYTLAQLQSVYNTVKAESSNVIKGYDDAIAQQNAILNSGGSSGTTGGDSSNPFSASNFFGN